MISARRYRDFTWDGVHFSRRYYNSLGIETFRIVNGGHFHLGRQPLLHMA
jgi:hypothetical protein